MSQPPQGEPPQDPDRRGAGWGPHPGQSHGSDGGWGPPSGAPGQGAGWQQQPDAGYGGPYGQPQQYPAPHPYGQSAGWGPPSQYGAPGQYGQPDRYGSPPGQPGQYGSPGQYGEYGAQYGQYGGWGQPGPPARRKPKYGKVFLLLVLALVIGLAFTLPARFGSTRLDPRAVQRDVATQFQQREGVALHLRCADQMTVEQGRTYSCDGSTADGQQVRITITITGRDGEYTWSDR
jgi:hypothetical protein